MINFALFSFLIIKIGILSSCRSIRNIKKTFIVVTIFLFGCGGATTEATTDSSSTLIDTIAGNSNNSVIETLEVRHKYSYVKLNEDGSKVAGLLELFGTNDYTQSVTVNGFKQHGRGIFYLNGDKITLSRISGIAIDGELIILKADNNKLWLTLNNGVTYVEDDNSSYLKSMTVTPSLSNVNDYSENSSPQNSQQSEFVYEGTAIDNQSGISQDYTLYIKSDFSSASIGGGPYSRIEDQGDGTYLWLEGTIIGMSFKPIKDKCIVYGSDGGYFCTLYRK